MVEETPVAVAGAVVTTVEEIKVAMVAVAL
jgi:hypothetical protein